MTQRFVNNFSTTVAATFGAADTFLQVASTVGLPTLTAGEYLLLTVFKKVGADESAHEVVKVTEIVANQLTVQRGIEGAAPAMFLTGDRVEARFTAAGADNLVQTAELTAHTADTNNPHGVTAVQVGADPAGTAATAVGAHTADANPHPQYQAELVSGTSIKTINGASLLGAGNVDIVGAKPSLQGDPAPYVTQTKTYQITNYNSFSSYAVAASAGTASISGDTITFTAPGTPGGVSLTLAVDGQPTAFAITVQAGGVAAPINTSPADGAVNIGASPSLQSSAFAAYGLTDTHLASRWTLYQGGTQVHSSGWRTDALTSYTVQAGVVTTSLTYTWTVEHQGTTLGNSQPSAATSFSTAAAFGGILIPPNNPGAGMGLCPDANWLATLGLSAMAGTTDQAHENWGTYQHTNGGVSGFIPKFYYREGDPADPAYATYGANTLTIKGIDTFSGEVAANVAGYALHRAFINNGVEVPGFFVDKYLASKDGTSSCKSVKNGNPISLTTSATYNPSSSMTGCTGILADAVVLGRARGAGWNAELAFQRDALAKITRWIAQHSTSTTHCAWYDPSGVTNFPKGCNTTLKDVNDATVTFTSAGAGDANKPLTGSASNLAKTTHNGQACGIADVNGAMYQVLLGVTMAGTSATDTAQNTTGNAYVLKRSARHANLTGGFGGTNDAWGTTSSLATNFDLIDGFLPWTSTTGWEYFGNGSNQVFSSATSGTDYLRSCVGIANTTGMSAAGTNQFGADGNYRYGRANLFPYASGSWSIAANAGVFYRYWDFYRSNVSNSAGFRCAAYGN